jgi:hypothetical protein
MTKELRPELNVAERAAQVTHTEKLLEARASRQRKSVTRATGRRFGASASVKTAAVKTSAAKTAAAKRSRAAAAAKAARQVPR